jgi:homoserine kinase
MHQVTVRVPASTSNLGPGFDCLGIALQLYNSVTLVLERYSSPSLIARKAGDLFFACSKVRPFRFSVSVTAEIPQVRGLGSSATVRTGVLHGLNALSERPLNRCQLFELVAQLEGHPDNAAPATFGGFNVARVPRHQRFPVSPRLHFVLLIPDFQIATGEARRLLPERLDRAAAVESCRNACAITAAFASQNYEKLRGAFADHLHQPFRKRLVPFLDDVLSAGECSGALGGFLSGSGSTIVCVTLHSPQKVADAMLAASGVAGARTMIVAADNGGARIL